MSKPATSRFYISRKIIVGEWSWEKLNCIVCALEIKEGDERIYCPYCGSAAHRDHILEWLKTHSNCPYCNRKLTLKELKHGG
ncbi:MAG: hypothetical protein OdinLCB4_005845 [Candidatus Odinarchaeum yellowstonii]|uniref:RING-type domain-containing protein n=1 Tax=Odinarchaeota yellowstonii (strain LCB_4) TaxID=1841599 RepID=A0AAF0D1M0_ODILC|nr:MAG: hypothetical protein OdinLCB4_005845 [Candidatus Odinarchaeum yellowstonii]